MELGVHSARSPRLYLIAATAAYRRHVGRVVFQSTAGNADRRGERMTLIEERARLRFALIPLAPC
jgi:hypothetical protein